MTAPDESWTEYGYRMPDGTEVWEIDHGTDGSWTPADEPGGLPYAIDVYPHGDGRGRYGFRSQLTRGAVMLTRTVTIHRGETQVHG